MKRGTILVTTNYIRCNMLGLLVDAGTELKYVSMYKGKYIVEFTDESYMPDNNGYADALMIVNPWDVKINKKPAAKQTEEFDY